MIALVRRTPLDVFVPHEHALALGDTAADVTFTEDLDGLSTADAVLGILDGPQVDDSTACEIDMFCSCRAASRPAARSSTTWKPRRRCWRAGASATRLLGPRRR
jgi:nucleoside 2-deoxyribosyltransferase